MTQIPVCSACGRPNPKHREERCAVALKAAARRALEGAVLDAVARTDAFYDSWPADTDAPDVDFQILGAVRERPSPIVVAPPPLPPELFSASGRPLR